MKYGVSITARPSAALEALPELVARHQRLALDRIAMEGERFAKRRAGKATSQLANSITTESPDADTRIIAPTVNYAAFVEEGSRPGYMPPVANLFAWIKQRRAVSFRNTRAGSSARRAQFDEIKNRAWGLAKHIQRFGTTARPFMRPAFEVVERIAPQYMEDAMQNALAEAQANGGAA